MKYETGRKGIASAIAALLLLSSPALAGTTTGGYFPGLPAAVPSLTGNEQVPADTNLPGGLAPQTELVSTGQLIGYSFGSAGGGGWRNALVGGDFGTNLWQRGTTSASITTAALYGPDRWAGLSGTSTAFTVIKETGAADITAGYAASARVQRTSGQTGILPVCIAQALTSANSTRLQGQKVEFVFHALAGANFSAANSVITASIQYGTGSDQSAATLLAGTWTTQAAISGTLNISSTWSRYSVVGTVPASAAQVGVEICYTPVGTAGANDWFEFTGAQLDVNPNAVALNGVVNVGTAASFERRPASEEANLQYAYFYRLNEPASAAGVNGFCQALTASTNQCTVNLPMVMRATVPTIAITTAGTFKVNIANTLTTIATPTAGTCSSDACTVTAANTNTAGQAESLTGGGGTGAWDVSAEL